MYKIGTTGISKGDQIHINDYYKLLEILDKEE